MCPFKRQRNTSSPRRSEWWAGLPDGIIRTSGCPLSWRCSPGSCAFKAYFFRCTFRSHSRSVIRCVSWCARNVFTSVHVHQFMVQDRRGESDCWSVVCVHNSNFVYFSFCLCVTILASSIPSTLSSALYENVVTSSLLQCTWCLRCNFVVGVFAVCVFACVVLLVGKAKLCCSSLMSLNLPRKKKKKEKESSACFSVFESLCSAERFAFYYLNKF